MIKKTNTYTVGDIVRINSCIKFAHTCLGCMHNRFKDPNPVRLGKVVSVIGVNIPPHTHLKVEFNSGEYCFIDEDAVLGLGQNLKAERIERMTSENL